MSNQTAIDFSSYSNKDLQSSLSSINRNKFEHNYQACLAEIEKRKANGTWDVTAEKEKQVDIFKVRKWARFFALVQAVGGVVGILSFIYAYGPHLLGGMSWINVALFVVIIVAFALTTWAGWKYWKTEIDHGAWRILLYMQVPCFQISGFTYEFYSGLQLPVGIIQGQLKLNVNIASNMTLRWSPEITEFAFAINCAPIIVLALLRFVQNLNHQHNRTSDNQ